MSTSADELEALHMEALSSKLLRHLPRSVWQELFLGPDRATIRFEQRDLTLLHAESPLLGRLGNAETFHDELAWLAECHLGEVEPSLPYTALVSFQQPRAALRMALGLQRLAADYRLRIGLISAQSLVATFQVNGRVCTVTLGPEVERVADVAHQATAGSILLAPDAYGRLEDAIDAEASGCVLMEEFHDTDLAQASLTPAPRSAAVLSTFAGLGLV